MKERPTVPADLQSAGRHDGLYEDQATPPSGVAFTSRTCPTCGSTGRCEGRLPTINGGWVCRAAIEMGPFRVEERLAAGPSLEGLR